jgi:hypothetical protein
MLTRDQILAAKQLPRETVSIPEWGGDVIVSVMSGTDRDAFEIAQYLESKNGPGEASRNGRARLCAFCVVDESGKKLFSESDLQQLGELNWQALERIMKVAQRLNKLTEDDMEQIKGNS